MGKSDSVSPRPASESMRPPGCAPAMGAGDPKMETLDRRRRRPRLRVDVEGWFVYSLAALGCPGLIGVKPGKPQVESDRDTQQERIGCPV
jgi:hypothetical protein